MEAFPQSFSTPESERVAVQILPSDTCILVEKSTKTIGPGTQAWPQGGWVLQLLKSGAKSWSFMIRWVNVYLNDTQRCCSRNHSRSFCFDIILPIAKTRISEKLQIHSRLRKTVVNRGISSRYLRTSP